MSHEVDLQLRLRLTQARRQQMQRLNIACSAFTCAGIALQLCTIFGLFWWILIGSQAVQSCTMARALTAGAAGQHDDMSSTAGLGVSHVAFDHLVAFIRFNRL